MNKIFIFLVIISIFCSCDDCYVMKRHFESIELKFVIIDKSRDNRFIEFSGYDSKNNKQQFKAIQVWEIFDSVEVGDTLKKEKGSADLLLIKKDTTLFFPFMCGGRYYQ